MHGVTVSSSSCTKYNLLKMSVCGINNRCSLVLGKGKSMVYFCLSQGCVLNVMKVQSEAVLT